MSRLRAGVSLDGDRAVGVLIDEHDTVLAHHAIGSGEPEPARDLRVAESTACEVAGDSDEDEVPVRSMCRTRHISTDFVPDPAHRDKPARVPRDLSVTGIRVDERAAGEPHPLAELLRRVLTGLADRPSLARLERVVVATAAPADPLARPATLGPVGVLRIGAPATTSVPPLTGWPAELAAALRGPVAVVGGGHQYDGREFAPLDLPAVRAFGEACRGTVCAVAVAGVDAHMNPAHEERARSVLAELLGPDTPVVTSHDVGGAGLLERENTVILGAAVAPAVQRFTDDAAATLTAIGVDADLYLVTGDGTVLPASRAVRHPLALLGATHGAARTGAARISGRDPFVTLEAGLFSQVAGVRTSIRSLRVGEIPSGAAGELAAAIGAATGEASGTVDRVYFYGDGGSEECVATARRSARELAIRRGADPRTVRVGEVREGAMTYVPLRCVRLRVTATGPVMATGGHPREGIS